MGRQLVFTPTIAICLVSGILGFFGLTYYLNNRPPFWTKEKISEALKDDFAKSIYPNTLSLNRSNEKYSITYTFDAELDVLADHLLKSYKPNFAGIAVMEADTGRVLLLKNYTKEADDNGDKNLAIQPLFPAASIFKVITAAAAIDQLQVSPSTIIPYNGSNHTLYRKNVEATQFNRWTRYTSVKKAFASSINSVFGKLGLFYVGPQTLGEYALRFGFNALIPSDLPHESGKVVIEDSNKWGLVETASGFTQESTLSPLHGALIAGAIVNNGKLMEPFVVEKVSDPENKTLYHASHKVFKQVVSPQAADDMQILMKETVQRGTSRKSFYEVFRRNLSQVDMGGKTGSLDSDYFKGRTDWFIGYLNTADKRYSIGVVTVHRKYWTVKSSYVAGKLLNHIYNKKLKEDKALLKANAGLR